MAGDKVRVEYSTQETMLTRNAEVIAAVTKIDGVLERTMGATLNGGPRVELVEILNSIFDSGYVARSWEPTDAAPERPRTTSEATGRPRVAGHIHERQEKATEPLPGYPEGFWWSKTEAEVYDQMVEKGSPDTEADAMSELRGWWEQTAHDEVAQLTAKMIEYGGLSRATDLAEIGRGLVNSGVKLDAGAMVQEAEARYQELGIYFYLLGKFARWTAAIQEGRPVSDDTLLDIGIYTRMAQRVRAVGGWPV